MVARVERMASKKGSTVGLREWRLSRREAKREGAGVEGRRDGGDDGGDRGVRSGSKGLKGGRNYGPVWFQIFFRSLYHIKKKSYYFIVLNKICL